MTKYQISRMVVQPNGQLAGIISLSDIAELIVNAAVQRGATNLRAQ
jgi:signal-transduction protein with cAMP-binding, CBS, and nucleotidyltransferase domain